MLCIRSRQIFLELGNKGVFVQLRTGADRTEEASELGLNPRLDNCAGKRGGNSGDVFSNLNFGHEHLTSSKSPSEINQPTTRFRPLRLASYSRASAAARSAWGDSARSPERPMLVVTRRSGWMDDQSCSSMAARRRSPQPADEGG